MNTPLKLALPYDSTIHWLDDPKRINDIARHIVEPRMSAQTMLNLVTLKNKLLGTNNSVYEASLIAEENRLEIY